MHIIVYEDAFMKIELKLEFNLRNFTRNVLKPNRNCLLFEIFLELLDVGLIYNKVLTINKKKSFSCEDLCMDLK